MPRLLGPGGCSGLYQGESKVTYTGVVLNGKPRLIPGLPVQNFIDNGALVLKLPEDGAARTTAWIRVIVLHTTQGKWPQLLKPGYGPHVDDAAKVNRYWTNNHKPGGAQFVTDRDGDAGSMCDAFKVAAYHAGKVNQVSEGIEIFQETDGDLYEGQLINTVKLVDALTWFLGIQRQVQEKYVGDIPRLVQGGTNAVGVYGHRDCSDNRGRGDPGDHIYHKLLEAGYEPVNYQTETDIALWLPRQQELNKLGAKLKLDGVAGPATTAAVKKYYPDKPRGLWVTRPIDDLMAATYGNDFVP